MSAEREVLAKARHYVRAVFDMISEFHDQTCILDEIDSALEPPTSEEERARFEEWAIARGYRNFTRHGDGYLNPALEHVWSAWQTATPLEDAYIFGKPPPMLKDGDTVTVGDIEGTYRKAPSFSLEAGEAEAKQQLSAVVLTADDYHKLLDRCHKLQDALIGTRGAKFRLGESVIKLGGYPFPGVVRSVFTTRNNAIRYVVENSITPGLLHIFNEDQLGNGNSKARST